MGHSFLMALATAQATDRAAPEAVTPWHLEANLSSNIKGVSPVPIGEKGRSETGVGWSGEGIWAFRCRYPYFSDYIRSFLLIISALGPSSKFSPQIMTEELNQGGTSTQKKKKIPTSPKEMLSVMPQDLSAGFLWRSRDFGTVLNLKGSKLGPWMEGK